MTDFTHHTPRLLSDADAAADLAGVARPVSSEDAMANYTFTIVADSGYKSTSEGRCSAKQYGAVIYALHNDDSYAEQRDSLAAERDALAVRVRELEAERDAITELNHAQWLALENVRHLGARNRNEEWAQHVLRWCTEAGNAARIMRATPSAPTAGPDERAMASELIKVAAWLLSPEPTRQIDRLEDQTHIGHRQFESAQEAMRETLRLKAIEIKDFADAARASKGTPQ